MASPPASHNVRSYFGQTQRFFTICADPPWQFGSAATKADARKHYSTIPTEALCAMPVEEELAAEDAHLWLWILNGMVEEGMAVCRAWGFRPITMVTWCKKQPGVGHYMRNNTEHLVFGTRGKPMVPEHKPLSTWYIWPRGAHSAKPPASYDLIESVSPGPYIELFARAARFGWETWGAGSEVETKL